ncbi:MAG: hypothetical protein IT581_00855 [Verrucomicrobiales bacterium]|nr:hypothetical protein [Verrucomicrobiales bacterium]
MLFRLAVLLGTLGFHHPSAATADSIRLVRVPEGGIQPQAALDPQGTLHLLYFLGDAAGGDLFYVRRDWKDDNFSKPIRVNHQRGSAMATGTIRGGQLAVGKNGRAHVVWNGPVPKGGNYMEAPMLYTRQTPDGTAFEPERDVITHARGLDGGGSVAADSQGNVWVFWHAHQPGAPTGETNRAVFVAHSIDEGAHFAKERPVLKTPTGACACCGMKAFADAGGNLYASYRAARDMTHRDQTLLFAESNQPEFKVLFSHPWEIGTCPMSSTSFAQATSRVLAAWEASNNVFFARIDPRSAQSEPPAGPKAGPARKHPVAIGNARDVVLLVWTEGTSWGKGGEIAWQTYSGTGQPRSEIQKAPGLPPWSLVAGVALPNDQFLIIY